MLPYSRLFLAQATNPLLYAMICALHRDRKRQLPADRVQLYEITCEMLLERRDQERGVDLQSYPRLTYRQKKQFLQEVAYWMLRNGKTEAGRAEAEACFARVLPTILESADSVQPGDVYRLFIEHSGMVREPGCGRIDFIHVERSVRGTNQLPPASLHQTGRYTV